MKNLLIIIISSFFGWSLSAWAQPPAINELLMRCAPTVNPQTMAAVISAESRGNPYAVADAGPLSLPWSQRKYLVRSMSFMTKDQAVAAANRLITAGHTVSLGLAQINDRNLKNFGISVDDVFDDCTNVAVGGRILTNFYERAVRQFGNTQTALNAALSAYNSGDWWRGERDGYVNQVKQQVGKPLVIQVRAGANFAPKLKPTMVHHQKTPRSNPNEEPELVITTRYFGMSSKEYAITN